MFRAKPFPRTLPFDCQTKSCKCRARRIKCDEGRPICSVCVASNYICDGYARIIHFDTEAQTGKGRHRQFLFTDDERKHMGNLMTNCVPLNETLAVIHEIDLSCEEAVEQASSQIDIFRGPFGAFRLGSSIPSLSRSEILAVGGLIPSMSPIDIVGADFTTFDPQRPMAWPEALFSPTNTTSVPGITFATLPPSQSSDHDSGFELGRSDMLEEPAPVDRSWPHSRGEIVSPATMTDLEDAPLLLKHYANNYISSLTPFRHTKTPWHILFLPNAKDSLASIAMGEDVDAANLVTFFGTLSLSALHLHRTSDGKQWQNRAAAFRSLAQANLQQVLAHAIDRPKTFKYKSIIIAILTMAQVAMAHGSWDQTDDYLLEAEKIIRLRGLTKVSKSRKVRLLHHCYAYMRIFHESLTSMSVRSHLQRLVTHAVMESGTIARGSDATCFRLIGWKDLDQNFQTNKTREEGENDLHLGSPGLWAETLYPEIFGIPETWMNLLSQVIRLANEKEMSHDDEDRSTVSLKEFADRAKALEKYILRWRPSLNTVSPDERIQIFDVDWILLENMQGALYHALLIYFYRRVHDVDSSLLQTHVTHVKEALVTCRELCDSGGVIDALMWPAFVAGCEALDGQLQASFTAWFQHGIQHDRFSSFARMYQLMRQVWHLRQGSDWQLTSWWQLLKGKVIKA